MITILQLNKHFSEAIELYLKEFNVTAPMIFNLFKDQAKEQKVRLGTQDDLTQEGPLPLLYNEGAFGGMVMNLLITMRTAKKQEMKPLTGIYHSADQTRPERMLAMSEALLQNTSDTPPPHRTNDSFSSNRGGPV